MEHSPVQREALARQYEEEELHANPLSTSEVVRGLQASSPPRGPQASSTQHLAAQFAALLADRTDAADILAAVTASLPATPSTQVMPGLSSSMPGSAGFDRDEPPPLEVTFVPPLGKPINCDLLDRELDWLVANGTATESFTARGVIAVLQDEDGYFGVLDSRVQYQEHSDLLRHQRVHWSPPPPQPLPPSPPQPLLPPPPQPRAITLSDVSLSSSGDRSSTSSVAPAKPTPAILVASNLPDSYKSSPDVGLIRQTLSSPVDLTLSHWFTRALYVSDVVEAWTTWSDPSSPPHRDAPDALAFFAEAESLDVPTPLLSSDPDVAALAWNHYRGLLINAFNRALVAGSDWRQVLRHLAVRYKHPSKGHARLDSYVAEALQDLCLLKNPPLHADVLIRQLDESFSANSKSFQRFSVSAEWDQTVARRAGEDVASLARRVIKAYVRKLSDAAVTAANVFESEYHLHEITTRFTECLSNDQIDPNRGRVLARTFREAYGRERVTYEDGEASLSELSCLRLAKRYLGPREQTYRIEHEEDQQQEQDEPDNRVAMSSDSGSRSDFAPPLTYQPQHRPEGHGARERRYAQRHQPDLNRVDE